MNVRRDCEIQSSIRRGEHVADGEAETVARVLRGGDTLESVAAFDTEAVAEELTLVAEIAAELTLVAEIAAELNLVAEAAELGDPPDEAGQTNTILLSCQVTVVDEKPDQTMPVTAFALAPANELNAMVTVWVLPVNPVIWEK